MYTSLLNFRKQYQYQINFYITTVCNINCSYCYARKNLLWNKIYNFNEIIRNLKIINKFLKKSFLSFLGGEPTLYPKFKEILNYSINELNNLDFHFYTNGSSDLEKILSFPQSKKINITMSLHFELFDNKQFFKKFLDNLDFLIENNYNFNLTIVFFNNKRFLQEITNIILKFKNKNLEKNIFISFIHDYFNEKDFEKYFFEYKNFTNNFNCQKFSSVESNFLKKCFYNEIDILYDNFYYISINNCVEKFLNNSIKNKFIKKDNKIILNNYNLQLLSKKKPFIFCKTNCIKDPAFYGSWEKVKE